MTFVDTENLNLPVFSSKSTFISLCESFTFYQKIIKLIKIWHSGGYTNFLFSGCPLYAQDSYFKAKIELLGIYELALHQKIHLLKNSV